MHTANFAGASASTAHDARKHRKGNGCDQGDRGAAIVAMLQTLDRLLSVAVDNMARRLGPATLLDPWRGMHLDADEVRRVLQHHQSAALTDSGAAEELAQHLLQSEPGARLQQILQLDALDVGIVAVALAPDIDLRYERIYAYLQDDISRKRPSPDLIANLLCASPAERVRLLPRFEANATLMHFGVLQWCGNAEGSEIARPIRVTRHWLNALACRSTARRADADVLTAYERAGIDPQIAARLTPLIEAGARDPRQIRLILQGPHGAGKHTLARAVAHAIGAELLPVDVRDCTSAASFGRRCKARSTRRWHVDRCPIYMARVA